MLRRIAPLLVAASVVAGLPARAADRETSRTPPGAERPASAGDAPEAAPGLASDAAGAGTGPDAADPATAAWPAFELLGQRVEPGTSVALDFTDQDDFTAYLVVFHGAAPGPTLCVTAGIHGDEVNGVAIARRLVDETDAKALRGTLIVAPIVNAHGFRAGSRYLPDRRDLNRHFPGQPYGSLASRIAHRFFERVVRRCGALVDLHTGSLSRTNLAQLRTDLREVDNLRLAWGLGIEHVVHSPGQPGTLRRAANDAGIPAVLYEAGEPRRLDADEIERGAATLQGLLASLDMQDGAPHEKAAQRLYGHTHWVRSDESGIYVPSVDVGDRVAAGQLIGEIADPFSRDRSPVIAPLPGRILGMALGQIVIPGFALFHIGIEDPAPREPGPESESGDAPQHPAGLDEPAPEDPMRSELAEERPE